MTDIPEISVVIPCLNEEDNVRLIYEAVRDQMECHAASFEILFIDNCSSDRTRDILREISDEDPRVWSIFNTRNFGQMRSPTHAIYQARGGAVVGMCADFQDPPELLGEFIQAWRRGAQIVLGVRLSEKSGLLLTAIRKAGYGFLESNADYKVIPGATGFGLYDRQVVDTLKSWHEPEPFFRGMLVESGFRFQVIPYDRPERRHGETKNNWRELIKFAVSGFAGSSKESLRLPIFWSMGFALVSCLVFVAAVIRFMTTGDATLWLMLGVQILLFSILLLFMGLLGEQVRLIAERTRNTALVIEQERVNFPPLTGPAAGQRTPNTQIAPSDVA